MYSELAINITGKYCWKKRNLIFGFLKNEVYQPLKDWEGGLGIGGTPL